LKKQHTSKTICFSDKVTLIQFVLSVAIIYQHTQWRYFGELVLFSKLQEFMFYLIEVAVPMFFMISGYLFYRTFSVDKTKDKLKSRVKTLLIPYLLWNVVYAVFFISMVAVGLVKNIHIEWNWKLILQIVNSDFSPLWFVKYLMVFTLIAPLMYYVFKNRYVGATAIVCMIITNVLLCVFGVIRSPLDVNANSLSMLNYQYIFYAIGAWAGLNFKDFVETPARYKRNASLCAICMLFILYFMPFFHKGIIIGHTFRIFFAIALWFLFDFLPEIKMRTWFKMSFWIYCSHTIVLQCAQGIIGLLYGMLGGSSIIWIAEWMVLPIVVLISLLLAGLIAKRYTPRVYNTLTGNRK